MSKASDPVTPDRLKEIRERAEKATKGPWSEGVDGNIRVYGPDGQGENSGLIAVVYKGRANASFIRHARADIPYLLERLESEREAAERETRMECARVMCVYCRTNKPHQCLNHRVYPDRAWIHCDDNSAADMPCYAAAIHELARGKGEAV